MAGRPIADHPRFCADSHRLGLSDPSMAETDNEGQVRAAWTAFSQQVQGGREGGREGVLGISNGCI